MKCEYYKKCGWYDKDSNICNKRNTNTDGTYYCGKAREFEEKK